MGKFEQLKQDLLKNGQRENVIINTNNEVLFGNTVLSAMLELISEGRYSELFTGVIGVTTVNVSRDVWNRIS